MYCSLVQHAQYLLLFLQYAGISDPKSGFVHCLEATPGLNSHIICTWVCHNPDVSDVCRRQGQECNGNWILSFTRVAWTRTLIVLHQAIHLGSRRGVLLFMLYSVHLIKFLCYGYVCNVVGVIMQLCSHMQMATHVHAT
jgi:hypothetical protein